MTDKLVVGSIVFGPTTSTSIKGPWSLTSKATVVQPTQVDGSRWLPADVVMVFGSNLAGRHGAGSAKVAVEHYGAVYGAGHGRRGMSYAIPTKDRKLQTLPLDIIRLYVVEFSAYAADHPDEKFYVVAIGCGLAGYTPAQIAPMFKFTPANVHLPIVFQDVLNG